MVNISGSLVINPHHYWEVVWIGLKKEKLNYYIDWNMENNKVTLNKLMTEHLKGKQITLFEYNADMKRNGINQSNYFIADDLRDINESYLEYWDNLTITKVIGTITEIIGRYIPYEGTSIYLNVMIGDIEMIINVDCDDELLIK
jgi:hypothetical protein